MLQVSDVVYVNPDVAPVREESIGYFVKGLIDIDSGEPTLSIFTGFRDSMGPVLTELSVETAKKLAMDLHKMAIRAERAVADSQMLVKAHNERNEERGGL